MYRSRDWADFLSILLFVISLAAYSALICFGIIEIFYEYLDARNSNLSVVLMIATTVVSEVMFFIMYLGVGTRFINRESEPYICKFLDNMDKKRQRRRVGEE